MPNKSSTHTKELDRLLGNVGDMALKRRAKKVILSLDLKKGDRVVDLGCGNGYYSYLLSHMPVKLDIHAIDPDKLAVKDAKLFNPNYKKVKYKIGSIEKTPYPTSYFDKAVMSEVIEHVENDKKALQEIRRILKPGGVLILTTPNADFPFFWDPINWTLGKLFNTHFKSGFWAGIWNQHDRLYRKKELISLLKNIGFKIEKEAFLTSWCLPFNHYIINFIARLLYSNQLPKKISSSVNKFKGHGKSQSNFITFSYFMLNSFDKINDLIPINSGVSIYIKSSTPNYK
jgi:ubiquinone/menaquinone biosynthesis C-methylase UbiE